MDAIELLLGRTSALKLGDPAPSEAELGVMFESAVRAPDHGRLRPWRFLVVTAGQRERFGELMAASLRSREPDASAEMLRRERDKAMRAPLIVVVAARIQKGRIPAIEQIASAAAATQNVMLAAHAQGFGAMWKTGAPAYDAAVKQALGFEPDDEIIGFLYLGTRVDNAPSAQRPSPRDYVIVWRDRE